MKLLDVISGCAQVLDLTDEAKRLIESAKTAKSASARTVSLCRELAAFRRRMRAEHEGEREGEE